MTQDVKEIAEWIATKLDDLHERKCYCVGGFADDDSTIFSTKEDAIKYAMDTFDVERDLAEEEYIRPAYVTDYLEDNLGIEYRIDENKEYRSCEICVAWGGPNIYVDTKDCTVNVYWGEYANAYFSRATGKDIDEVFSELFYLE